MATTLPLLSCAEIREACKYANDSQATQGMSSFCKRFEQLALFCVRHDRVEDLYVIAGHFVALARESIAAERRIAAAELDFRERIAADRRSAAPFAP